MQATARRNFLRDYGRIRKFEGRGCTDAEYYRSLPFVASGGGLAWQWRIRAASYRCFECRVLLPLEYAAGRPLVILDAGAGNAWLSNRLTQRGHRTVALDIFNDALDGLAAVQHYSPAFPAVEADFDELPFAPGSFDLVIYNSSFHYSSNYRSTLAAARHVLRKQGSFVILDSPVYRKFEHGERMRRERQLKFENQYGFRSEAAGSVEFLDENMLQYLSRELQIQWSRVQPWLGWKWSLRPIKAWLRRERPPSRFILLSGRFLA